MSDYSVFKVHFIPEQLVAAEHEKDLLLKVPSPIIFFRAILHPVFELTEKIF